MTNQLRAGARAGLHVWLPGLVAGVGYPWEASTTSAR